MHTITKTLEKAHTGLTIEARAGIIERLNTLLADEHLLYTKTRNYHWNVTGIHFASLHAFFEEHYNRLQVMADAIAERTRQLGGTPIGTMAEFSQESRLSENPGTVPAAKDMIANLLDDHEQIISTLRKDIDACTEEFGDEGTADLLTSTMGSHDEMAWMLRAHLD
ncbi:MAG: DNA starvation/stationary phase protection protein [Candidatus Promineifilaceae bacterium]|nr:DNA starvation/stationary phase protection protein [Anaerolineaceae bacterium]